MIQLKNVSKQFVLGENNIVKAVDNVSLDFAETGMTFVLGPSGCGKSTLLNIIGGLDKTTSGSVVIDGENLTQQNAKTLDFYRSKYVGFIFQEYNLLEKFTVYENLELAISLIGENFDIKAEIAKVLDLVKLSGYEQRKVSTLSGGEKQRITIARVMLKNPKIIIADEPTGALDSENSKIILDILKKISKDKLVLVVSHNEESAEEYADRTIRMKDGKIVFDTGAVSLQNTKSFVSGKAKMPFRFALKFGFSGLKKIMGRMLTAIFLTSVALALLCTSFSGIFHNNDSLLVSEMLTYKNVFVYNSSQTTSQGFEDDFREITSSYPDMDFLKVYNYSSDIIEIKNRPDNYYYQQAFNKNFLYYALSSQEMEEYNYTLVYGDLPTASNEIAIPKFLFDTIKLYGLKGFNQTITSFEDLALLNLQGFNIVGVIDTKVPQKYDALKDAKTKDVATSEISMLNTSFHDILTSTLLSTIFITENALLSSEFSPKYVVANLLSSDPSKFLLDFQKYKNTQGYRGPLILSTMPQNVSMIGDIMKSIKDWCGAFGAIALVVGFVTICNFVAVNILNRKKEIGILRALGAGQADCFKIFAVEIAFMSILSLILGILGSLILLEILGSTFSGLLLFETNLVAITPLGIIITILACGLTAIISLLLSIRKLSKLTPANIFHDSN